MSGGSNNLFFIFLIIIPIGLIIFMIFKKKNGSSDKKNSHNQLKSKQERDEVWLTIKRYLRDQNEIGKEVVDSYVVKRPDPRILTKEQKKAKKQIDRNFRELKKSDRDEYENQKLLRKIERRKKIPELYVVLFTTRNTKTLEIDRPRAIECEVVYKKTSKKTTQRTIQIQDKVLDYNKEMEWIRPIKEKDDKEIARQIRVQQKRIERRKKKNEQKKLKEEQKTKK